MLAQAQAQTEQCPWCSSAISHERFVEIQNRIRAQEEQKRKQFEADLTQRLQKLHAADLERVKHDILQKSNTDWTKRLEAVAVERDQNLAKLKELEARESEIRKQATVDAQKAAELQIQQFRQQQQTEVVEIRAVFQKERDDAVLKKQAEFAREREAWQKKISEMDRQVKNMTANQIGDGAEIDLFEALKGAFEDDHITRVPKGTAGADIKHEVRYRGQSCGHIIYDSKNRKGWHNSDATKLREDQEQSKAEHAVLSTSAFPIGKKELCIEADVIVVNPARAVLLAAILRAGMIKMQIRGLSLQERQKKTDKLYKFITSDQYMTSFRYAIQLKEQLLELDVQEKKSHDRVWKQRGTLLIRQGGALDEIDTEIAAIIDAAESGKAPAA